jgi:hypothetical protein
VNKLVERPEYLIKAYKRVEEAQKQHTWQVRARQVAETLEGLQC